MAIGKGRITRRHGIADLRFDILGLKRGTYDQTDGRVIFDNKNLSWLHPPAFPEATGSKSRNVVCPRA